MSKLLPSISGLACLIWVTAWSWWLSLENSNLASSNNSFSNTSISIVAPDTIFKATGIFSFHKSDDVPVIPADNIKLFKSLAAYMGEHPEQSLTIVGAYLPMPYERNQSPYPNLGIARSNAIKKILVTEGANPDNLQASGQEVETHNLVEGRLLGAVEFIFGEIEDTEEEEQENEIIENTDAKEEKTTPKKSTTDSVVKQNIAFVYEENEFSIAKKNRADLDELRRLIRKNPSYKLIIAGYSAKAEEKAVNNLAERRSLAVRRYLVDTGVRRRNIIVESYPGAIEEEGQGKVEISIVK